MNYEPQNANVYLNICLIYSVCHGMACEPWYYELLHIDSKLLSTDKYFTEFYSINPCFMSNTHLLINDCPSALIDPQIIYNNIQFNQNPIYCGCCFSR